MPIKKVLNKYLIHIRHDPHNRIRINNPIKCLTTYKFHIKFHIIHIKLCPLKPLNHMNLCEAVLRPFGNFTPDVMGNLSGSINVVTDRHNHIHE